MKRIIAAVFLFCLPLTYSRHVEFYRKDYAYIQEFDAFYKVHWNESGSSWNTAFSTCEDEGATLFYPKVLDEWIVVKNLANKMTELSNITEIYVGLHDEFKLGEFITVDGHSTPYPLPADGGIQPYGDNCITMNINTGKFSVHSCLGPFNIPLPFVCKKVDEVEEESCPTVDPGYKFMKKSKKCIKINKKPKTWQEAMKTCFMEGGILTVIENTEQAQEIIENIVYKTTYFVGVKELLLRSDYYTVKGQKFSDMYQNSCNGPNPCCGPTPDNGPNPYNNGQYPYDNNPDPYDNSQIPNENGDLPDENDQYPDENGQYPKFKPQPLVNFRVTTKCGTVCTWNNDLYTITQNCDEKLPFICEMEVGA